mmetsp:Transcript_13196/g.52882  ORF Transcript_13196/g.52882 Transcript_13196/m.52882 type:complete len:240 (-) Transcript_13196:230-949(-)
MKNAEVPLMMSPEKRSRSSAATLSSPRCAVLLIKRTHVTGHMYPEDEDRCVPQSPISSFPSMYSNTTDDSTVAAWHNARRPAHHTTQSHSPRRSPSGRSRSRRRRGSQGPRRRVVDSTRCAPRGPGCSAASWRDLQTARASRAPPRAPGRSCRSARRTERRRGCSVGSGFRGGPCALPKSRARRRSWRGPRRRRRSARTSGARACAARRPSRRGSPRGASRAGAAARRRHCHRAARAGS